ncbi:MAG: hypothetical protein A2847_02630 [Candidatus Sungbacteria bacterium RIFCSPHIGHO2_01_FULL_50_25]|uniref:Uncharacterized protein n=1 Tax=Candidatus Sungbacteria bacterium RIFCSPHIGHO2_01_FULL_50_25 TaxID=1802265 RepID=A0A1G2K8H5_9BACT|nr:MAG: hypothetical protein A2847_02630 [Candidatus Sungbacteria bacterium RIFCSPHIGHO2_01_FULL_50_25]
MPDQKTLRVVFTFTDTGLERFLMASRITGKDVEALIEEVFNTYHYLLGCMRDGKKVLIVDQEISDAIEKAFPGNEGIVELDGYCEIKEAEGS